MGLRRLKDSRGLFTAPVESDGAAGARGQWKVMELLVLGAKFLQGSVGERKNPGLGMRKPCAKAALWPQGSHLTWGLAPVITFALSIPQR